MEAAARPAPAAEEPPSKKRRGFRPPTSVLVTIVVAALSVWIAPALTRQWDDRQKARELQVRLVELVSSSTAQVQSELAPIAVQEPIPLKGNYLAAYDARVHKVQGAITVAFNHWELSRLKVDTRLRIYYGDEGLAAWRAYVKAVRGYAEIVSSEGIVSDGHRYRISETGFLGQSVSAIVPSDSVDYYVKTLSGTSENDRQSALSSLGDELANRASRLVDLIVDNAPRGFSTTRSDLLHDLLP
jgi:hypothetical protein